MSAAELVLQIHAKCGIRPKLDRGPVTPPLANRAFIESVSRRKTNFARGQELTFALDLAIVQGDAAVAIRLAGLAGQVRLLRTHQPGS